MIKLKELLNEKTVSMGQVHSNPYVHSFHSPKQIKEDGHTDVPSAIRKLKTSIEDANEIMEKLNSMSEEESLPSWWTNKVAVAVDKIDGMADYLDTQVEELDLDEASKEGTVKIIKTKDGKFQIQKMTKGKFVDIGKPYNSQKEAEKFRSGQPDLFGEEVKLGERLDPADVDDNASEKDVEDAGKNIIMQLRKSVSMRGNKDVEFASGKQKVDMKIAQKALDMYNKMKPQDKTKFQTTIAKSYKDLLNAIKGN